MNEWEWQLLEDRTILNSIRINGVEVRQGDRVRLKPRARGDVFDLVLTGKSALIEAIEEDYEGHTHLAVVLDDDPGRDLGMLRQPGHRFFFSVEEVEPLLQMAKERLMPQPGILIAGIGNIFLGDDAFGCEVIKEL
jgi:hypothetical protein